MKKKDSGKVGDIKTFDRIEKKCLITAEQKKAMLDVIREHMWEDGYFISDVFNVYFDTENFDTIIQSIEQPIFKEKLRARSYGGYDKVFFEIKTKYCGKDNNVGYKRRVCICKKDYLRLIDGKTTVYNTVARQDNPEKVDLQIAREVDYLIEHMGLAPRILVSYRRESYQGEDGLRITFDEDLRSRVGDDLAFEMRESDQRYFEDEKNVIMEIKAHGVLPLWLARKLSQERIFPQQFSKVGKIYQKIGKEINV